MSTLDQIEPLFGELYERRPDYNHLKFLSFLDRTQLPAWQLGLTCFFALSISGILMLILVQYPDPGMYSKLVAFVAVISYLLVFYLEMGRGWHRDYLALLAFDDKVPNLDVILAPSKRLLVFEIGFVLVCTLLSLMMNDQIKLDYSPMFSISVFLLYYVEYLLAMFCLDIFIRQLIALIKISASLKINLFHTDFYSNLANGMFRFLRLFIFGLCLITLSFNVYTDGELSIGELMKQMSPFYMPGIIMLLLYLVPFKRFRLRMREAKDAELFHIERALSGDKAHLSASLIGDDASRLTKVDLLYYEERIKRIKEWPFTDRIRSLLLFGVLPPLTWVVAALIEISIESVL